MQLSRQLIFWLCWLSTVALCNGFPEEKPLPKYSCVAADVSGQLECGVDINIFYPSQKKLIWLACFAICIFGLIQPVQALPDEDVDPGQGSTENQDPVHVNSLENESMEKLSSILEEPIVLEDDPIDLQGNQESEFNPLVMVSWTKY